MTGKVRIVAAVWLALCGVAVGAVVLTTRPWSRSFSLKPAAESRYQPPSTAGSFRETRGARPAPARPGGYVGSRACAECHAEIYGQYAATPMGQSLASVDEAMPVEGEQAATITPPGNRIYRVVREEGKVFHSEVTLDGRGDPLFDLREEVRFVLGSGKRGRAYLINRNGRLFQSPIGWYAQSHGWDLSPG
ncbi:MAG: cytochrome c family protein, partial [Planctomycetes bacterium]|nr:cytochrome c family protein [Planctomycetota bacterium]